MRKVKKSIIGFAIMGAYVFISCGEKDKNGNSIEIPSTYTFKRNGKSTVDFSGQTTRIKMSAELAEGLSGSSDKSPNDLLNMFNNENAPFSDATLNSETTKQLSNKTAASSVISATDKIAYIEIIKGWINGKAAIIQAKGSEAIAGKAGYISYSDGQKKRYVDKYGRELNQLYAKGMIGALLLDQILNNYFGKVGTAQNDATTEGKTYTDMEHYWDEAYGYLYGRTENSPNPEAVTIGGSDLHVYLRTIDTDAKQKGIKQVVFEAFKRGRAAIVAKQYGIRDDQISILREKLSLVPAYRAVYYLKEAKEKLSTNPVDRASVFHALSEAYGFIFGLPFTRKPNNSGPYIAKAQVEELLSKLSPMSKDKNGFWELVNNPANGKVVIDEVNGSLATAFGFKVADVGVQKHQ